MSNHITAENAKEINQPIAAFLVPLGFELDSEEPSVESDAVFKFKYRLQLTDKVIVQAEVSILGITTSYHHNIQLSTLTKTRYGNKWIKNYLKLCNDLEALKKYLLEEN